MIESLVLYLVLGIFLTYLCWGFVIAVEINLILSGSEFALKWMKEHYNYERLYKEVSIFYPIIYIGYIFLEVLPYYIFGAEKPQRFDLRKVFYLIFSH